MLVFGFAGELDTEGDEPPPLFLSHVPQLEQPALTANDIAMKTTRIFVDFDMILPC